MLLKINNSVVAKDSNSKSRHAGDKKLHYLLKCFTDRNDIIRSVMTFPVDHLEPILKLFIVNTSYMIVVKD